MIDAIPWTRFPFAPIIRGCFQKMRLAVADFMIARQTTEGNTVRGFIIHFESSCSFPRSRQSYGLITSSVSSPFGIWLLYA